MFRRGECSSKVNGGTRRTLGLGERLSEANIQVRRMFERGQCSGRDQCLRNGHHLTLLILSHTHDGVRILINVK